MFGKRLDDLAQLPTQGCPMRVVPVLAMNSAGLWLFDCVWKDLMNAILSTCLATCVYLSQTHCPLSPYCWNENGDFINGPGLPKNALMLVFWPSRFVNSGFGSNMSTALGAPSMNSQMTAFALAGKWPSRGFNEVMGGLGDASRFCSASRFAIAIMPAPPPAR